MKNNNNKKDKNKNNNKRKKFIAEERPVREKVFKLQIIFVEHKLISLAKTSRWGLPAKGSNRAILTIAYLVYLI